jgi:hypothetical protein
MMCRDSMRDPMQSATLEPLPEKDLELIRELLASVVRDREAMLGLQRIAERYARLPRDSYLARELVADVIYDVTVGDAKCDAAQPMSRQLERHVQRRAARLRESDSSRRPRRPRFVPLDEAPGDTLVIDAHPLSFLDESQDIDPADWVARIRVYATGDDGVQQLLAFYDQSIFSRRDVLEMGMKEWVYRAAREKLLGYATVARADICSELSGEGELRLDDVIMASSAVAVAPATRPPAYQSTRAQRAVVRKLGRTRTKRSA